MTKRSVYELPENVRKPVETWLFYYHYTETVRRQLACFENSRDQARARLEALGVDPDQAVTEYFVPAVRPEK